MPAKGTEVMKRLISSNVQLGLLVLVLVALVKVLLLLLLVPLTLAKRGKAWRKGPPRKNGHIAGWRGPQMDHPPPYGPRLEERERCPLKAHTQF